MPEREYARSGHLRMNKLKSILLCSLAFILLSCIREDLSECPPPINLELTFSYRGDMDDPSMFVHHIDQVTLMVYDENEKMVLSLDLNKNDLTTRQGVELCLEPGNYKIICWGNAHEHTELYQCESFTTGTLHHPSLNKNERIPTNSHLYYGSYNVQIPNKGTVQGDIPFRSAHINVEVYVRNATTTTNVSAERTQIEAHNLMPQYNMGMFPTQAYSTTYYPETTFNTEKELVQALFQVFRFDDNNPVLIEVKDRSGQMSCHVQLKRYMADNKISVNSKNEATVAVLVEFTDFGTVIRLPEWIVNEVDPVTR